MSTKHTPGPWGSYRSYIGTEEEDTQTVAYCDDHRNTRSRSAEETNANGRLIAAAPDLLDALEGCVGDLEHYVSTHGPGPDKRLAAVVAAIAKARGE